MAFNIQGGTITAKKWDGPTRKKFRKADYAANEQAFEFLKRDMAAFSNYAGRHLFPVLYQENYDIDAGLYLSESDFKKGNDPIALVELEMKSQNCCKYWDGPHKFPKSWPTGNFLGRKAHLAFQKTIPFWICYNFNGTDCMILPMEELLGLSVAQNSSIHDLVYPVPKCILNFGRENILPVIDRVMAAHYGCDKPEELKMADEEMYRTANRVYQKIHRSDLLEICDAHQKLTMDARFGTEICGVSTWA